MKIFIICSVRDADKTYRKKLESYVNKLEAEGNKVHLPHRDTDQTSRGISICKTNRQAIESADEIHVFYKSESQGTHFDLGMAFMSRKKIVIVENVKYGPSKSYPRMINEWQNEGT